MKIGEHRGPLALSNSPSSITCREAPARRRDMVTVGNAETEDASAEIVLPIRKQTWRERCLRSPGNNEELLNHHVYVVRSGELLQSDQHPRGKWKRWRETAEV